MIKLRNVSKVYKNNHIALSNVSVAINKGEFVFVVGPSGAGKSTFIKLLMKEVEPTSGEIAVNGINVIGLKRKEVPYYRRNIGVVFQDFRLLPNLTVYENVAFAMLITEALPKEIRRQVPMALALVGLSRKANMYPHQLSGGEQQRVALARALVNNPSVLIADEPTGNLDPDTSWEIMELLKDINNSGTTILMATHAKEIVDRMRRRVIALEKGVLIRDEQKGVYGYED
jgi:cell division transport system ATP-binding protein